MAEKATANIPDCTVSFNALREEGILFDVGCVLPIPAAFVNVADLLLATGLAENPDQAKRLLAQGGIEIDGKGVTNNIAEIRHGSVIRLGKRRFLRLVNSDIIG